MGKYNDLTNFPTQNMSMMVSNIYSVEDFVEDCIWSYERLITVHELADRLNEMMESIVFEDVPCDSNAYELLDWVYQKVDWEEIADVMINDAEDIYECRLDELRKEAEEEKKELERYYFSTRGI